MLLAPLLFIAVLTHVLWGLCVHLAICLFWCGRGRPMLFVYSDSSTSREYVEQEILPKICDCAVILNWSDRKRWQLSLAVIAFRRFGGNRAFVPIAVVFRPFRLAKIFRFYEPFQEYKHGKHEKVEQMKTELFAAVKS
jgi:hypothetical protein